MKIGQIVQFVSGEVVRAAVVTEVVEPETGGVRLTVFIPGGGAHGLADVVQHANYAAKGESFWRAAK